MIDHNDIEWGDPPPPERGGGRQGAVKTFVAALKARPGQWAKYPKVFESNGNSSHNAHRFPGTEWTSRKQPDGRYVIYGRWVGIKTHPEEVGRK